MEKVLIMISTFNGEKYISKQLDTILNQENVIPYLIIRDDGSSDSTVSILRDYMGKFPEYINLIEGKNIGWKKSFFQLMQYAGDNYTIFNYFAFADQDDIWLPNKLGRAIEMIQRLPSGPQLYCSNLSYYKNGVDYGLIRKSKPNPTVKGCLMRNYATGCTVLFNRQLLNLVKDHIPTIPVAHDYWCYLIAVLCGNIVIDHESFIYYRQHDKNEIGSKPGFINVWKRRLKSLSELIGNHDRERLANEFLSLHSKSMHPDAFEAVKRIALYRTNLKQKFALLADSGYSLDKVSSDFWIKLRIIFNRL